MMDVLPQRLIFTVEMNSIKENKCKSKDIGNQKVFIEKMVYGSCNGKDGKCVIKEIKKSNKINTRKYNGRNKINGPFK